MAVTPFAFSLSDISSHLWMARQASIENLLSTLSIDQPSMDPVSCSRARQLLLLKKIDLIRQGAPDSSFEQIDRALVDFSVTFPQVPLGDALAPYCCALLPASALLALLPQIPSDPRWWLESHASDGTPLHALVDAIGERGLYQPPPQHELFASSSSLRASLIETLHALLRARPHWVHAVDLSAQTPLHWAVYLLAEDAIEPLLLAGANPAQLNLWGSPALDPQFFSRFLELAPGAASQSSKAHRILSLMERLSLLHCSDASSSGSTDSSSRRL